MGCVCALLLSYVHAVEPACMLSRCVPSRVAAVDCLLRLHAVTLCTESSRRSGLLAHVQLRVFLLPRFGSMHVPTRLLLPLQYAASCCSIRMLRANACSLSACRCCCLLLCCASCCFVSSLVRLFVVVAVVLVVVVVLLSLLLSCRCCWSCSMVFEEPRVLYGWTTK